MDSNLQIIILRSSSVQAVLGGHCQMVSLSFFTIYTPQYSQENYIIIIFLGEFLSLQCYQGNFILSIFLREFVSLQYSHESFYHLQYSHFSGEWHKIELTLNANTGRITIDGDIQNFKSQDCKFCKFCKRLFTNFVSV